MTALTVRLPDEKHRRLKALAKCRGTPLNRLIDEVTTIDAGRIRHRDAVQNSCRARCRQNRCGLGAAGEGELAQPVALADLATSRYRHGGAGQPLATRRAGAVAVSGSRHALNPA